MFSKTKIRSLLTKITALETYVTEAESKNKSLLKFVHHDHQASAKNLLHYLAIRTHDLRNIQKGLSDLAISSSSHAESYTLNNLQKIRYILETLAGITHRQPCYATLNYNEGLKIAKRNAAALLGKASFNGESKIMVTLPSEAGSNHELVRSLVKTGMQIARINTAHDNQAVWERMVSHIRRAEKQTGKKVKIYMDLEGPKIRTGGIQPMAANDNEGIEHAPFILLHKGSKLQLLREQVAGRDGINPAISCTLPVAFDHINPGERVWFDDGKIGGVISSVNKKGAVVTITHAPKDGGKLKAEKGINFPDSRLDFSAITVKDSRYLPFVAAHADMVGFSFVQKPEDILLLQKRFIRLKREDIGIILKIETHMAFVHLPKLILAAMRSKSCGIMIARGDLAVELGYLRMAEVQEEIAWLAEAAHLPLVWATQVLETQVKKGAATRAEISDVVKAVRAECVMLNKGPFVLDAIATIKDIDKRMASHEEKKMKTLRSLQVAKRFFEEGG